MVTECSQNGLQLSYTTNKCKEGLKCFKIFGINQELTFQMARHTFATTVTLTNGVPIESISKMLGHTKIQTTQIYAKILDKKVSNDMQALRNKFQAPKIIEIKTGS